MKTEVNGARGLLAQGPSWTPTKSRVKSVEFRHLLRWLADEAVLRVAPMGYPRHALISLQETQYYHCVSRCVRRGWLCGLDAYSGKDYSHRKDWVIERMTELSHVFAIDVCSYAVMSNHYHQTLFVDLDRAKRWSDEEVVARWTRIHQGPSWTLTKSRVKSVELRHLLRWLAREVLLRVAPMGYPRHSLISLRETQYYHEGKSAAPVEPMPILQTPRLPTEVGCGGVVSVELKGDAPGISAEFHRLK